MKIVTSWWGTLLICGAVWLGTISFLGNMALSMSPEIGIELYKIMVYLRMQLSMIAGFISSIFALLFIHLVLK